MCSVFHVGGSIGDKRQKQEVLGLLKEWQVIYCGWSTGSMALRWEKMARGVMWPWAPHRLLLPSTVVWILGDPRGRTGGGRVLPHTQPLECHLHSPRVAATAWHTRPARYGASIAVSGGNIGTQVERIKRSSLWTLGTWVQGCDRMYLICKV